MRARRPGDGIDAPGEAERLAIADREARARAQQGLRMASALNGSRAARRALGERMAAVTRENWAGDRRNGEPRG